MTFSTLLDRIDALTVRPVNGELHVMPAVRDDKGQDEIYFVKAELDERVSRGHMKQFREPTGVYADSKWVTEVRYSSGLNTCWQQYGLLESVGKGETRITQLAMDIFHPLDNQQRRRALAEAAFRPEVFKAIHKHFGGVPSADALRSYLIRQNFFDRAIDPIIEAYTSTSQFLKQEGATESDSPPVTTDEDSDEPEAPSGSIVDEIIAAKNRQVRNRIAHMPSDQRVLTKGLLSKGATFEIIVSGQIGLKELNMLIRKLELDKEILAEDAEEAPDSD